MRSNHNHRCCCSGIGGTPHGRRRHPRRTAYTVSYNSESHWSVLTQLWGSQWPKVLPFCLFNVALLCALTVVDRYVLPRQNLSIDVSRQGHTFINIVVSFLLLSRVRNGMERYNRACDYLHTMIRSIQAVVQDACVLSSSSDGTTTTSTSEGTTTGTNDSASAWRHEVAYRSLMLLRASMAVMDFPIKRQPVWDLAEWNGVEQDYILRHYRESLSFTRPSSFRLPWTRSNSSNNLFASTSSSTYLDEDDVLWELSLRIPARLEFLLQTTLHSQRLRLEKPIQCSQETRLFTSLAAFMTAYGGMCKFLTTPIPFPLIQMARTILFIYVFTVPFVLLSDTESGLAAQCAMIFVFTYGFVGLEFIAIELDNPFGTDQNDFDHNAMAMIVFEDTYLCILDMDGPEWTDKLRLRMIDPQQEVTYPSVQCWMPESDDMPTNILTL